MNLISINKHRFMIEMDSKEWCGNFDVDWDDDIPNCQLLSLYIMGTDNNKISDFSLTSIQLIELLLENSGKLIKQPEDEELLSVDYFMNRSM